VSDQFAGQLRLRASPPTVPPGLVRRTRLEQQLGGGSPRPVTLLSAGPGFGKTLAVASWLERSAIAAVWLTVDDSDNDLRTFWSDVLGALAVSAAVPDDSPLREIAPATTFAAPEARQIRSGLAELPIPVVLVLDEVHQIRNPEVLDSLSSLIEHRPPPVRLVLITRADPQLRLHRLRVADGLTEIRSEDLAFTKDETAELLARSGLDLTDDQLRVLQDRTQGWPVGVRLAAMFLASTDITRGIKRFTGNERSVAEYLVGEMLDFLPAADRDFLLRTSITPRIGPSLATALTGRRDSESVLRGLVASNAFVVGLGDDSGWFRYHPLLRDLLEHRLNLEQPGSSEELHRRAAQWFAAHGQPIQAIRHSTTAGDWDEAGRLLTATALPLALTPHGPALAAALEPLARRSAQEPNLTTLLAAAIWHFQQHDFDAMHQDATEAAEFLPAAADAIRVPAEILIAATALTHDRVIGSAALVGSSDRLLSLLHRAPRRLVPAARHYQVIGMANLGVGQLWAGDLEAAEDNLTTSQAQASELGVGLTALTAGAHLAVLDVIHGRLDDAHRRSTEARQVVDRRGWAGEPEVLAMYVAAGMTLLARNLLTEASDTISAGLAASSRGSDTGSRLALGIAAVGVAAAQHDTEAVRSAADRLATELARVPSAPDLLAGWCAVARAQALIVSGDPTAAVQLLGPPAGTGFAAALHRVTLARAHLARAEADRLPELLDPLTEPGGPYPGVSVEARILLALAADRQHRDSAAMGLLTQAIDVAAPEGLVRPFLDAGPALSAMITRHRHVVARHLDFTRGLLTPSAGPDRPAAEPMVEHLTERELVVLHYLPTMLTAGEIADDLYLSVNTVKSHLRSIYRKLDTPTRRAAVERARDLDLL
jgi:LuxR family maltose regulon positive regulatory protein